MKRRTSVGRPRYRAVVRRALAAPSRDAALSTTSNARAALTTTMSRAGPFSPANMQRAISAFSGASPPASSSNRRSRDVEADLRGKDHQRHLPVMDFKGHRLRGGRDFVQAIPSVDDEATAQSEAAERSGKQLSIRVRC